MNLEPAYLEAALPDPVIILGQKLEPFSLGHEMLLRRHRSPFATSTRFTPDNAQSELLMAVFICCQRYEEANESLRSADLPAKISTWKKNLGPFDEIEKMRAFESYRTAGRHCPKFKRRKKGGRPGAPWLLSLLHTLIGPLHQPWSSAINMPLGQAQWLYCAYWEAQGSILISTEDDEDLFRRVTAAARALGLEPMRISREPTVAASRQSAADLTPP